MTVQEFFDLLARNPEIIIFYVVALPLTAFLASVFGKGEGHLSPWKYLYCFLVYVAMIPGIFAILLNMYLFLFEKQPILQTNIYTQILPVLVMFLTLWLVRRNVPFDLIPGFEKITGLILITFTVLGLMWILDKTRIIAITYLPFHNVLLILLAAFIIIRIGLNRMFRSPQEVE